MKKKLRQKFYGFLDNLIWIGHGKFSLLLREYSQSRVNVLSSTLKILDLIKNNFLKLNFAQDQGKPG